MPGHHHCRRLRFEAGSTGTGRSFTITARDAQGELCGMDGDVFVVELINEWGEEVEVNLKDNSDGTYLATYTVPTMQWV